MPTHHSAVAKNERSRWEIVRRVLGWVGLAVVLLYCVGWVLLHAFLVDAVTVRLCGNVDPPTTSARDRLPVFLGYGAYDGYVWNRHAEKIGENGEWRLRHTDFDNAPQGREMHWNSGFVWYLRGLGEIYSAQTQDSLRNSIFRMSIWANSILLILGMVFFSIVSARWFGVLSGVVVAIAMITVPTFYRAFQPAAPDHHGVIALAILGLLLGVARAGGGVVPLASNAGEPDPASINQARTGMIFSAVFGAVGFWISALSMSMVLGALGVGVLVSMFVARSQIRDKRAVFMSGLWKLWAICGASGSLVFYLVEYFPRHLGMRLEVNHPLYALAWLGGGWMIALLAEWICGTKRGESWVSLLRKIAWPLAACGLLPAMVLIFREKVYIPLDPLLARYWPTIDELQPLMHLVQTGAVSLKTAWSSAIGYSPLLLLLAAGLVMLKSLDLYKKVTLILLSVAMALLTGLQFHQVRWGLVGGAGYIAIAAIVIPSAWMLLPSGRIWRTGFAVIFVLGGLVVLDLAAISCFRFPMKQYAAGDRVLPDQGQAMNLLYRQITSALMAGAGGKPMILLGSPSTPIALAATGGFQTIASGYWENVEGLRYAARVYSSQDEAEARALLEEHGVTHIAMVTMGNFVETYCKILHANPSADGSVENSFGYRVFYGERIPEWLRPIDFPASKYARGLGQQVKLFEVLEPDAKAAAP